MDPSTYGERIADVYDDWYAAATDVEGTVATIVRLAGAGPVLELGIGTGRLALPLVAAGVEVHGIDASQAMVARLRAKPGGDRIPVTIGDFADVAAPGPSGRPSGEQGDFAVVLLAFNALLNLTTGEAQARCLRNAAARAPLVVVETFVPGDAIPPNGVEVRHVGTDEVRLAAYRIDDGVVAGSLISITEAGIRLRPWHLRLAPPAEIDRLAAAAGLAVAERWAGWRGEPFDDTSERQVTVYRRDER